MAKQGYGDQNGKNPSKTQAEKLARIRALSKGSNSDPDWGRVPCELVGAVVTAATREDGAIRFGYSRDGGAYSVALYLGGPPETAYFHSDEDIVEYLNQIWENLRG